MRRLQLHYCITTNNLFFFLIFFLFNIFIWCRCVQSFVVFTFDSFSISMFFMLSRFFYLSFFVFTFALSFYISFQFLILLLVQNADLNPGFCVSKWMWFVNQPLMTVNLSWIDYIYYQPWTPRDSLFIHSVFFIGCIVYVISIWVFQIGLTSFFLLFLSFL